MSAYVSSRSGGVRAFQPTTFESNPTILQKFHKGALFEHGYWDPDSGSPREIRSSATASSIMPSISPGELKMMKGRVRLCPYYFVESDRVKLRGALATIAPADKKFLHGMSEAILVPSRIVERNAL